MSYQEWSDYGYGFNMGDLRIKEDLLKTFLGKYTPVLHEDIMKTFTEAGIENPTLDDYEEWLRYETYDNGFYSLLGDVIKDQEDIHSICALSDFDGNEYVVYVPNFPWYQNDKTNSLTMEGLTAVFDKYAMELCGETVPLDYYEIRNGG